MVNACLLPVSGMDTSEFCDFIDLEKFDNIPSSEWGEDSTITHLANNGWIRRTGANKERVALHPIVTEISINELDPEITTNKCECFCKALESKMSTTSKEYYLAEKYIEIVLSIKEKFKNKFGVNYAELFDNMSRFFHKLSINTKDIFELQAVSIEIKKAEDDKRGIKWSYNFLSWVYSLLGNYGKAIDYKNREITLEEECVPINNDNLLTLYQEANSLYRSIRNYKLSLEFNLKALKIAEETIPQDKELLQSLYRSIGYDYSFLKLNNQSIEYFMKSIEMCKAILLDDNADNDKIYIDLGHLYYLINDFDTSLKYYLQVIKAKEKSFSDNKKYLIELYRDVADIYEEIEDDEKHLIFINKSYETAKQALLDNNFKFECDADWVVLNTDDNQQKLEYYFNKLNFTQKRYPDNHPNIGKIYNSIGRIYHVMKRHKKALEYYKKSELICEQHSENIGNLLNLYERIAELYDKLGNNPYSSKYELKSIKILETVTPQNDIKFINMYASIGNKYKEVNDYENTLKYLMKVLEFKNETTKLEYFLIFKTTYQDISCIYRDMDNHEKALEYKIHELNISKENSSVTPLDIANICDEISDIYYDMGKYEKALEHKTYELNITKKNLPNNSLKIADIHNDISYIFSKMANHEKALEHKIAELKIKEKILPQEDHTLQSAYSDFYYTFFYFVKKELGTVTNKIKALKLYEKNPPVNNKFLAELYGDIADTYSYYLKDYEKALEYRMIVLSITREFSPETSLDIAEQYDRIGNIYSRLDNTESSLEYKLKALKIREQLLPQNNPELMSSYNEFIRFFRSQKNSPYQLKALEQYKNTTPINYNFLYKLYSKISERYYYFAENYPMALKYKMEGIILAEKVFPVNSTELIEMYNSFTAIYRKLDNSQDILPTKIMLLELYKESSIANYNLLSQLYDDIGDTYKDLKDYKNALLYKTEVIKLNEEKDSLNDIIIALNCYKDIINIYFKTGKFIKAFKAWRKYSILKRNFNKKFLSVLDNDTQ